ncbi:uncharacterized protein A4U43_C04F15920 [Asparagus officinalis]|uniref:Uncharacterized protein n=1 Tax=Asparagus officinalis TaxID=4686 RepID=A0A5P1F3X1_ASPOF|nr:uncharacterized protein A4U43_C04F15920 [Asparagus officinalis]
MWKISDGFRPLVLVSISEGSRGRRSRVGVAAGVRGGEAELWGEEGVGLGRGSGPGSEGLGRGSGPGSEVWGERGYVLCPARD